MTAPQQQKHRIAGPVVITGNRLDDGKVVYAAKDGSWVIALECAAVAATAAEAHARFDTARELKPDSTTMTARSKFASTAAETAAVSMIESYCVARAKILKS